MGFTQEMQEELLVPSMTKFDSILIPLLHAVKPKNIMQIGVEKGELTEILLHWVESNGGHLTCVDQFVWKEKKIDEMLSSSNHATWSTNAPLDFLQDAPEADLYIINDDYNYYTVYNELQLAYNACTKAKKPFLALVRGTGWPFSRRDAYHNPDLIPEKYRHPHTWSKGLSPDRSDVVEGAITVNTLAFANQEGGDNNGVLIAIWDFLKDKKELIDSTFILAYCGLHILFSHNTEWAKTIRELLKPETVNLILALEENRIKLLLTLGDYQYYNEQHELHRQNLEFDAEAFCQKIESGEGKRNGLGLVSVIIPTYNRPQMLLEAVKSVLKQTYTDIEIVVINDAGEDVNAILNSLNDKRIISQTHPKNMGLSAARNTGIRTAKGIYIAYLDDDDLFHPQHIETLLNALHESGRDVAYTDTFTVVRRLINAKLIPGTKKLTNFFSVDLEDLLIHNRLSILAVCHKKSCIDKVGYFDETLKRLEDWDMWIRLSAEYHFLHIPRALSEYSLLSTHTQMTTLWVGYFLNSLLAIHNKYRHLTKNPNTLIAQNDYRERLRYDALTQLEQMSDEQIAQLPLKSLMEEIVEKSIKGTEDDRKGAQALLYYLTNRFPDEKNISVSN